MRSSSLSSSSKQIQTWFILIQSNKTPSLSIFQRWLFWPPWKPRNSPMSAVEFLGRAPDPQNFAWVLCQTRTIHTHKLSACLSFLVSFWKHVQIIFKCTSIGLGLTLKVCSTVCYDMLISKLSAWFIHFFRAAKPERSRCPRQWVHCFPHVAAAMLVRRCWDGTSSQVVSTQRGSASVRFAKSSLFGGHNTSEEMV